MTIKHLIEFFETFQNVPVEIQDVLDQVVESYGIVDEIVLHQDDVLDPDIMAGMLGRYTKREHMYDPVKRCVRIVFSGRLTIEYQRLVVCKELVHLFDKPDLTTNSKDEINALIDNLVEGFDLARMTPGDWQAIKDKLALYQALAILFPHEAREELVPLYEKGQIDEAWIAEAFCIPQEYVEFLMSSKWDSFRKVLLEV